MVATVPIMPNARPVRIKYHLMETRRGHRCGSFRQYGMFFTCRHGHVVRFTASHVARRRAQVALMPLEHPTADVG